MRMYGHLVMHIFLFYESLVAIVTICLSFPSVAMKEARDDTHRTFYISPNCLFLKNIYAKGWALSCIFHPTPKQISIPRHKIEWKNSGIVSHTRIWKIKNWPRVLSSQVAGKILREENYFPVDATFNCKLQNLVRFWRRGRDQFW